MSNDFNRVPIIRLWDQILVPLQGEVTDALAERLRSDVLETIHTLGADGLVIDVTGVWTIDSHLCSVISRLAAAARLMGTRSIICGMSADIAMTLQTMGIDLTGVKTALTVELAFESLGVRQVGRGAGAATAPRAADPSEGPPTQREPAKLVSPDAPKLPAVSRQNEAR
jgi:rsbT antagonist protein RsbS